VKPDYYYTMLWYILNSLTVLFYGVLQKSNLNSLQILQNRAVRILTLSAYKAHSDPLFHSLPILKIADIYKLQIAVFVHKSINRLFPPDLNTFYSHFSFPNARNNYQTRNTIGKLELPSFRTEIRKCAVLCHGPRISFPIDIKSTASNYQVKKQIKIFLCDQYLNNDVWVKYYLNSS